MSTEERWKMLKPDAPTRRRIIQQEMKPRCPKEERWKYSQQDAPTRRRIIPQEMKPRCPNKRDERILNKMHPQDVGLSHKRWILDVQTREMKEFSTRCIHKKLKKFLQQKTKKKDELPDVT